MGDEQIRAGVGGQAVPEFENPAYTPAPPLNEATVAIVTSAGLIHPGEASWAFADPNYRVFATEDTDIRLGHPSPNFDRSGFVHDRNVAYPVDRLKEMAAEGAIKAVGPRHLSFMGAQDDKMDQIRSDTGPKAAAELKADGVNVVLLTPI